MLRVAKIVSSEQLTFDVVSFCQELLVASLRELLNVLCIMNDLPAPFPRPHSLFKMHKIHTASLVAALATVIVSAQTPPQPHLAQAWQAESTGDGEPNKTGLESYIYEDCKETSDTCMHGHIFNYGANTCIKFEVDRGDRSEFSGTFYVKCESVNCCKGDDGPGRHAPPDVKKWDIGQAGKILKDNITYLGKLDTTELNGKPIKADAWNELFELPFTKDKVNYTYFVTIDGNDTITHRIDYSVPGLPKVPAGAILYGNFTVQHDLDSFRDLFKAPADCLKPNTLKCHPSKVQEWERKYFSRN